MSEERKLLLRDTPELLVPKVTSAEDEYRNKEYPSSKEFLKLQKIKCSVCPKDLKSRIINQHDLIIHPSLEFIICKTCFEFYGNGEFSVDEDGSDKYCRWCGQGGSLYCCSDCSVAICAKCVKNNFPRSYLRTIEGDDWRCFVCDPEPIWPQRALCYAAKRFIEEVESVRNSKRTPKVVSDSEETEIPVNSSKRSRRRISSREDSEVEEKDGKKPKRSRRQVTSSEKTEDVQENIGTRSKRSRRKISCIEETDEAEEKKVKENLNKRRHSSGDEAQEVSTKKVAKNSKRAITTDSVPKQNDEVKLLEGLVQSILMDYDKLTKVMVKSKQEFCERYLGKNLKLDGNDKKSLLKEKLLDLLRDSKESIENIERTFHEGWKSLEAIGHENGMAENSNVTDDDEVQGESQAAIDGIGPSSKAEVDSQDVTVIADDPVIIEECLKDPLASSDTDTEMKLEVTRIDEDSDKEEKFEDAMATEDSDKTATMKDSLLNGDAGLVTPGLSKASSSTPCKSNQAMPGTSKPNLTLPSSSKNGLASPGTSKSDHDSPNSSKSDIFAESQSQKSNSNEEVNPAILAKKALLEGSDGSDSEENTKRDDETDISGVDILKSDAEEETKTKSKQRLRKNIVKRSALNSTSSEEDPDDKEIKRLNNLRSIARKSARGKISTSSEVDESTSSSIEKEDISNHKLQEKPCDQDNENNEKGCLDNVDSTGDQTSKEKIKEKVSKKKEKSILEYLDTSDNYSDDEEESTFSKFNSTLDEKRKEFGNKEDFAKSFLLHSSDENVSGKEDEDSLLSSHEPSPKKLENIEQSEKIKQKGGNVSSDEENIMNGKVSDIEESDKDNFETKKKVPEWRKNYLLRRKLSETDTSDDERRMERIVKKENEQKSEKKNDDHSSDSECIFVRKGNAPKTKSSRRVHIISSDSESVREIRNSSSESDCDDFFRRKRKKKKPKRRKRIQTLNSSESEEEEEEDDDKLNSESGSASKGRKNIRKVMEDEDVGEKTRKIAKEEEARKKRIQERQELFNKVFNAPDMSDKKVEKLVLDFDEKCKKELIAVSPKLLKKLKPHQAQGVKFMWDSCFESVKQIEKGVGGGCILAHCMGLGKTLQVITLIYTLLTSSRTKIRTVLVICPLTTVLNWYAEFEMWLKDLDDYDSINVWELTKQKNNNMRVLFLKRWTEEGGVMIVGYEMFRSLVNSKTLKQSYRNKVHECLLDPGPDLVICDEGHMLKNEKSAITRATAQIKSLRRIVLTGTPLQNNLVEYHCMVQFVKPNLLGNKKEFMNRFVTPITNGQYHDSRDKDVRLMKRRAHVLHKMLDGIVQRYDYKVLTPFLPPKHEFVISVAVSDLQAKLYSYYIEHKSSVSLNGNRTLFKDYQIMRLIWTHPLAMKIHANRKQKTQDKEESDDSLKNFVVSDSDVLSDGSDNSVISVSSDDEKKPKTSKRLTSAKRRGGAQSNKDIDDIAEELVANQWWNEFVTLEDVEDIKQGPKLILLFAILRQCELIGDKVLVFSQSIPSLDMIEYFLTKTDEFSQRMPEDSMIHDAADFVGSWTKNVDYFRLDGQTPNELRSTYCKAFNQTENNRSRLFLISTKAGGLGINLTAANRVIIFDASWNPSYDIQSIFRVYRFGQTKPCYIYRFLSQGTMEEKIYERQVTKLSVSCRVVDEQQIDRHFSRNEIEELYKFNRKTPSSEETPKLPSDRLMAELLKQYRDVICSYHEHDSLLENVEEEELTEEERKLAWEDYENEKNFVQQPQSRTSITLTESRLLMMQALMKEFPKDTEQELKHKLSDYMNWTPQVGSLLNTNDINIIAALRKEHPDANDAALSGMLEIVRHKLYMREYYNAIDRKNKSTAFLKNVPAANGIYPGQQLNLLSEKDAQLQMQQRNMMITDLLQKQAKANNTSNINLGSEFDKTSSVVTTPEKKILERISSSDHTPSSHKSPSASSSSSTVTPTGSPAKNLKFNIASPLKTPSTWSFNWYSDKKNPKDLQTLIEELCRQWDPKFSIKNDRILMHLPFCVRRKTIEMKLQRFLSMINIAIYQEESTSDVG